jgi:hypothetical protein
VITTKHASRLRFAIAATLAGVLGAAVVGLGYAAAGPSASAQEYQYGQKVTICHHTGSRSNPHRTITVSRNALPAHTRHGDTVGPCPSTRSVRNHSSSAHVRKFHKQTTLRTELRSEAKAAKAKKDKNRGKGKGKGK